MPEDTKVFVIAGCKVTLHFHRSPDNHWTVQGVVSSGEQDHQRSTIFKIDRSNSRDEGERLALKQAGELLGDKPGTEQQHSGAA